MIAIGLMSGTSLDGIDAALVRLRPIGDRYDVRLLNFETLPFERDLDLRLRAALSPSGAGVGALAELDRDLGQAFAQAALAVRSEMPVDFVASHGQTIRHDPGAHPSVQIGDPFVIREALAATVCYDFRRADCAAGGSGAPLVPHVDTLLFAHPQEDRAAVNIGGIANVTILPAKGTATAFDTGPGVMLLDAFVRMRTNGSLSYDSDGALGERGTCDARLLEAMQDDPYFAQPPPKSTGRERFGEGWLRGMRDLDTLSLEDGAATLAELTAWGIAQAIRERLPGGGRVLLSGGGARNRAIFEALRRRLPGFHVESSAAMGVNPDAKEAIAFAVLGYELLRERPAGMPAVTGARHPAVLGAIAPFRLGALLAKVEAECRG